MRGKLKRVGISTQSSRSIRSMISAINSLHVAMTNGKAVVSKLNKLSTAINSRFGVKIKFRISDTPSYVTADYLKDMMGVSKLNILDTSKMTPTLSKMFPVEGDVDNTTATLSGGVTRLKYIGYIQLSEYVDSPPTALLSKILTMVGVAWHMSATIINAGHVVKLLTEYIRNPGKGLHILTKFKDIGITPYQQQHSQLLQLHQHNNVDAVVSTVFKRIKVNIINNAVKRDFNKHFDISMEARRKRKTKPYTTHEAIVSVWSTTLAITLLAIHKDKLGISNTMVPSIIHIALGELTHKQLKKLFIKTTYNRGDTTSKIERTFVTYVNKLNKSKIFDNVSTEGDVILSDMFVQAMFVAGDDICLD